MIGKNCGHMSFGAYRVFLGSLRIALAALCAFPAYAMDCTIGYNDCKTKAEITCRLNAGACSTFKASCDTAVQTCKTTHGIKP